MSKPKLVSISMYEKKNNRWIGAKFNNEEIEGPLGMIDVQFSLHKEGLGDVAELTELATAKTEKYFEIMLKLMNELAETPSS